MTATHLFRGLAASLMLLAAWPANAQDFRVYTRIYDANATATSKSGGRPAPVARSTSLFHAGKVYDCQNSGNQMTIFEPAQERFVIIDGSRRLAVAIPFAGIRRSIYQASQRGEAQLDQIRDSGNQTEVKLASHLEFQLHPSFEEQFDEGARVLTLSGRTLKYTVKCATADRDELIASYLEYADWAASLNFVMNPQAHFPGARQQVNESLRRRSLLPVEVSLRINQPGGLHLTAEHRFDWRLDTADRHVIRYWEKLLHDRDIKHVSLSEFKKRSATEQESERR